MEKLKSETAIRCAKVAILLSSLKSSSYDSVNNDASQSQVAEKVEDLELECLKRAAKIMKLVNEKQKLELMIRIGVIVHFVCVAILLYNIVECL